VGCRIPTVRVLLAGFGSRGDIHPLLALALALRRAGHEPRVTGPPDFARDAGDVDVPYIAHGPNAQELLKQNQADLGANPLRMIRLARSQAAEHIGMQFEALNALARDADMIVAAGLMWAASSVAQARGLPYRYVAYAPEVIPSRFHAPPLCPWQNLPGVLNRWLWRAFQRVVNWLVLPAVNRHRAELGLLPLGRIDPHVLPRDSTLLAADPEIAGWASDAGISTPALGALQFWNGRPLEPAIERFLAAGEPPVYIGFGSMVDAGAGETTRRLLEVVERVGCRAIIGAGWAGLGGASSGERVLFVGPTPHRPLFARLAAVVHHGGAGTTHTAARAGVPQLLVPHLLDQFSWAKRTWRLGLSPRPIPRSRLSTLALERGLRACLTDEGLRQRASQMKRAIERRAERHDPLAGLALTPRAAHPQRSASRRM
jgi:vancomycin aglycone glucosyltransferase